MTVSRWIRKLLQVRDTPEATARGLAVGFFFGVSLFFGLQMLLAAVVSHFVRGNKVIAVAMTAISNPLTSLPLYSACYALGLLIVGSGEVCRISPRSRACRHCSRSVPGSWSRCWSAPRWSGWSARSSSTSPRTGSSGRSGAGTSGDRTSDAPRWRRARRKVIPRPADSSGPR